MHVEKLILQHKDSVYRQLVRVCGNHDDAEDALADAILAAIKSIGQLKQQENFRAWLSQIGRRSCARHRIRHRLSNLLSFEELHSAGIDLQSDAGNSEKSIVQSELKHRVQSAVEGLPAIYREVYILREIEQQSAESVAEKLRLTIPAVKSRLHRARALVRQNLDACIDCLP